MHVAASVTYNEFQLGAISHLVVGHIHRQTAAASGSVHTHQVDPAAAAAGHTPALVAAVVVAGYSRQAAEPAVWEAAAAAAVAVAAHSLASVAGLDTHWAAELHQLQVSHNRLSVTITLPPSTITITTTIII